MYVYGYSYGYSAPALWSLISQYLLSIFWLWLVWRHRQPDWNPVMSCPFMIITNDALLTSTNIWSSRGDKYFKVSKEKLIILHSILVANWLFRLFASLHYISAFRQQTTPHEAKWSKESRRWFWEAPSGAAVWQLWVSDAHELCCTTAIMLT